MYDGGGLRDLKGGREGVMVWIRDGGVRVREGCKRGRKGQ